MDRYIYNCNYCGSSYVPNRRYKQKYCSNSCRVNAFKRKKTLKEKLIEFPIKANMVKKDNMSLAGIGNAAIGTLATNIVTNLFTKNENMPATKGDIQKLINSGLYQTVLIKNAPIRSDGAKAYFDTIQQIVIYKKTKK